MKVICTQENFSRSLMYLERVVGRQTTLPILSNFLLETENGRLKVSATNLEIGVMAYIGAKIEKTGRLAVPAKILSNFIHNLPTDDVLIIEADEQSLQITGTTHQMRIKGVNGKDFPIIPQYKEEYIFSFPAQALKNALSKLLFCVSLNESRFELTGVHILFFEDELHLAATDSFRLAEVIIPFIGQGDGYKAFLTDNPSMIIPASTLSEIIRVINPESKEVKVALVEHQVFFEVDGVQIVSRLINGKYPDYKQIIPKQFKTQVIFNKEELQRAVKIASTLSSYSNEFTMTVDPQQKKCTLTSQSQEIGDNKTVLDIEVLSGDETFPITFNPRYILDGMSVFLGERIQLLMNTSFSPAAFRSMTDDEVVEQEYIYLMMPIKK